MSNLLVVSIKPEYMEQILRQEKKIELRKSRPSINEKDTIMVLYCTAPVKAVVGICRVSELIVESPQIIWKKFSHLLGIDEASYFEYYGDREKAFGLRLEDVHPFSKAIPLDRIRKKLPSFAPPQTYKYYDLKKIEKTFRAELGQDYRLIQQKQAFVPA